MPFSMWRVMFSITTMASSTTNPVAIVSAISDRLSRVYPQQIHDAEGADQRNRHRDARDEGGPAVAQEHEHHQDHEARSRSPCCAARRCTEARMVMVRSLSMLRLTFGGSDARNCGSSALMRSTVSMMLAFGWRRDLDQHGGFAVAPGPYCERLRPNRPRGPDPRGEPARRCGRRTIRFL